MEHQLNNDIALKAMNYSKHEFVKMNQVGLLVSEAVQGLLDKMHQKDKTNAANKQAIRLLDVK